MCEKEVNRAIKYKFACIYPLAHLLIYAIYSQYDIEIMHKYAQSCMIDVIITNDVDFSIG